MGFQFEPGVLEKLEVPDKRILTDKRTKKYKNR